MIAADFLLTVVKATRRSIDEPPGIEVGMFEFGEDCLDCCPLVACLEVLNLAR